MLFSGEGELRGDHATGLLFLITITSSKSEIQTI